jgi:hypothetical protein
MNEIDQTGDLKALFAVPSALPPDSSALQARILQCVTQAQARRRWWLLAASAVGVAVPVLILSLVGAGSFLMNAAGSLMTAVSATHAAIPESQSLSELPLGSWLPVLPGLVVLGVAAVRALGAR